jgi:hypothetical protein
MKMSEEQPQMPELTNEEQIKRLLEENARLDALLRKAITMPNPDFPKLEMPPAPVVPHTNPIQITHDNGMYTIPSWQVEAHSGARVEIDPPKESSPVPPPKEGKGRIMIGVPILMVSWEFFESFLKFWTALCSASAQGKLPFEVCYHFVYRTPVHTADTKLVKAAQFNKCTHILFMDDDIFDVTIEDLMKLWEAKKEFISGIMYASKFPHAMCAFRRYDPVNRKVIDQPTDNSLYRLYEVPCLCPKCGAGQTHWDGKFCPECGTETDNMILRVDLVPFPFTLIDLKVFDRIKTPWFHTTEQYPTDSWFCDRCMEAGIEIFAHMGVRLNHAGITDETRPHFMAMGAEKSKKAGGIIGLHPQDMAVHQYLLDSHMRATEEKLRHRPIILGEAYAINEPKEELTILTTPYKDAMKV